MSIIISKDGKGAKRIGKSNFDAEDSLQKYIYQNPESIPLYDIKEDIRLLILAREFSTDSGPIDAIGVDKDGEIYLVETKLYKNPDKRLVVAQVLDYGASLWRSYGSSKGFIDALNEAVTAKFKSSLAGKLNEFFGIDDDELSALLESVEKNLQGGSFRFVVLMDKLHHQLKDLIIFINENSKFDIFAVELEYYKYDNYEIVIPKLFGAEVKKDIGTRSAAGSRKKWDEDEFIKDVKKNFGPDEQRAIQKIYDFSKSAADEIRWGTGVTRGSFNPVFVKISEKSLYTIRSNGQLSLNFGWLDGTVQTVRYRDDFKRELEKTTSLTIPKNYQKRFVYFPIKVWKGAADSFIKAVQCLLRR